MSCILDDPNYRATMSDFDNDSNSCLWLLLDLQMNERFLELMKKDSKVSAGVKEALVAVEIAQEKIRKMEREIAEKDDTVYYDGDHLSNMGWVMASNKLELEVAYPSPQMMEYLEQRTGDPDKAVSAIDHLIKQKLISKRQVPVTGIVDGVHKESVETCVYLTEEGRALVGDSTFVYSSSYNNVADPDVKLAKVINFKDRVKPK